MFLLVASYYTFAFPFCMFSSSMYRLELNFCTYLHFLCVCFRFLSIDLKLVFVHIFQSYQVLVTIIYSFICSINIYMYILATSTLISSLCWPKLISCYFILLPVESVRVSFITAKMTFTFSAYERMTTFTVFIYFTWLSIYIHYCVLISAHILSCSYIIELKWHDLLGKTQLINVKRGVHFHLFTILIIIG